MKRESRARRREGVPTCLGGERKIPNKMGEEGGAGRKKYHTADGDKEGWQRLGGKKPTYRNAFGRTRNERTTRWRKTSPEINPQRRSPISRGGEKKSISVRKSGRGRIQGRPPRPRMKKVVVLGMGSGLPGGGGGGIDGRYAMEANTSLWKTSGTISEKDPFAAWEPPREGRVLKTYREEIRESGTIWGEKIGGRCEAGGGGKPFEKGEGSGNSSSCRSKGERNSQEGHRRQKEKKLPVIKKSWGGEETLTLLGQGMNKATL